MILGPVGKPKDPYVFTLVSVCPPPTPIPPSHTHNSIHSHRRNFKTIFMKLGMIYCHVMLIQKRNITAELIFTQFLPNKRHKK